MSILRLIASLDLNKSGFDTGMKAATSQVTAFGDKIKGFASGAAVVAMAAWTKGIVEATSRIKDLSEQTGLTTDEIQNTDFAMKQSGMAFEDLSAAMNKLGTARREAVEGNLELRKTFERYGLTVRDLNDPQNRNYDLLLKIARALSGVNITAREQTDIMDLLGAKAGKLTNVLANLADFKPPTLIRNEDIEAIDKATKAMERLKLQAQAATAPAVGAMANVLTAGLRFVGQFGGGNRGKDGKPEKPKGLFEMVAEEAFGPGKNAAEVIANPIAQAFKGLFNAGVGAVLNPAAKDKGGLFDVDKNAKAQGARTPLAIQADQFGRIGAFTGRAADAGQREALIRVHGTLRDIQRTLDGRGILIRGTD